MLLNDIQRLLFKHKRLSDKISTRKAELENLDHDFGKNEYIIKKRIKEWEIEKNLIEKELKKYLINIDIEWR